MFLLDTNHCIYAMLGDIRIQATLDQTVDTDLATCSVVVGELVHMVESSHDREANRHKLEDVLSGLTIHPIDEDTAEIYGQLKAAVFDRYAPKDRKQRRRTTIENLGIGDNDLWIAAIAIQHHLTLVTADRDFARLQPLSDLAIATWL
jgi:tRNA(fMet)-specific endonuclease VapC